LSAYGWEKTLQTYLYFIIFGIIAGIFLFPFKKEKSASENIKIPYRSPLDGKYHNYIPDFMIQYTDKNGSAHVELIEIKPANQTTMENARNGRNQIQVALNAAKWTAAQEWCKRKGIRFKVLNEDQIFQTNKKRNPKKRISKKRVK